MLIDANIFCFLLECFTAAITIVVMDKVRIHVDIQVFYVFKRE